MAPAAASTSAAIAYACKTWPAAFPYGCTMEAWSALPYWQQQQSITATTAPAPVPVATPAAACPAQPAVEPSGALIAVGDSITYGANSTIAYPSFAPMWGAVASNWGVSGDGSADMLARFPAALASAGGVVVLHCCTNDVQRGIDPAITSANVSQMLTLAKNAGKRIVLVLPLPRNNVPMAGLVAQTTALESAAAAACVRTLSFWEAFESSAVAGQMDPRKTNDGVHPNTYGSYVFMRRLACGLGWWCGE